MTIDCDQVLVEIELYLDQELASPQCREIEEHLAGCGPCLQRKEFKESIRVLIARKCGSASPPEELLERIRNLLASEAG
jgi:mycothiol system anti-sigma-R factor